MFKRTTWRHAHKGIGVVSAKDDSIWKLVALKRLGAGRAEAQVERIFIRPDGTEKVVSGSREITYNDEVTFFDPVIELDGDWTPHAPMSDGLYDIADPSTHDELDAHLVLHHGLSHPIDYEGIGMNAWQLHEELHDLDMLGYGHRHYQKDEPPAHVVQWEADESARKAEIAAARAAAAAAAAESDPHGPVLDDEELFR